MFKDIKNKYKKELIDVIFYILCLVANIIGISFLLLVIIQIVHDGYPNFNLKFLTSFPSRIAGNAGALAAIVGSIFLMFLIALFAIPIGVGAAIYLEEYAKNNLFTRFIKLNIKNLAGIPSIIYGLIGVTIFVKGFDLGRCLLSGALTMTLLILPIIIMTSQEALKTIPNSLRLAGFAIGMTRWQVIYYQLLPLALPGMMTGIILALSRAIGETAPLIMVGALTFVTFLPSSIFDSFSALPILIFNWTARPQKEFHAIAATGIIVLLILLILMNITAIYLRGKYRKKMKQIYL